MMTLCVFFQLKALIKGLKTAISIGKVVLDLIKNLIFAKNMEKQNTVLGGNVWRNMPSPFSYYDLAQELRMTQVDGE